MQGGEKEGQALMGVLLWNEFGSRAVIVSNCPLCPPALLKTATIRRHILLGPQSNHRS